MKKTVASIIAHHIVGVPALDAWSLKNSKAFHIVAFSRICFPSFSFCKRVMYEGVTKKPTKKVASPKPNIETRFVSTVSK